MQARGGDLIPETIPPVGLLIVRRVGTFDFDRQKPGINSEAVTKSVPRGFLKVTLLEKGICIYHGLCNLFFGVLHGMLFCCFISGRLYIFELFSFIFIRVLRPSLRPQN